MRPRGQFCQIVKRVFSTAPVKIPMESTGINLHIEMGPRDPNTNGIVGEMASSGRTIGTNLIPSKINIFQRIKRSHIITAYSLAK